MSSVPRHSEEELRQQWAFLDALVDRQAASLKSGIQDPEEDDAVVAMAAPESNYLDEISTLTQRVTTLEDERTTLLRRIDLAEEARLAAESGRDAAESARVTAERALADERSRLQPWPQVTSDPRPVAHAVAPAAAEPVSPPVKVEPVETMAEVATPVIPAPAAAEPDSSPPEPPAPPVATFPKAAPPTTPAPKEAAQPGAAPKGTAPKGRRKSWWQRIRE